jgi:post-segregation antitoxin (ccd killing protein)
MIRLYIKTIKIKEKGLDMGRKRIESNEKRISLKLSIKKKYVDELKEKEINISQLFEQFVKDYLKR